MAAGGATGHSIGWDLFFIDLEQLVLDYEQLKASNFTTNYSLDETLRERFENAVQALRNVLPHVHHSHSVAAILSEIHTISSQCSGTIFVMVIFLVARDALK